MTAASAPATAPEAARPLLRIEGLRTAFQTDDGPLVAVDDVSFDVLPGETVGVVGESGCGKSVTALSVMRLIPNPPGRIVGGRISFDGEDLLSLPEARMRALRGSKIGMIFQEPMTSLNPVFTVGEQIAEGVRLHRNADRKTAWARAVEMLQQVGIPAPAERAKAYPHELSGGMRQRVMIAMALACDPRLLIADEPTTALDVTIQAQILELLRRLQRERHMSVLLITHDLGVVAETCERVVVMYAGKVVERAAATELFSRPRHPYTGGLLRSVPTFDAAGDGRARATERPKLHAIPGVVPSLTNLPGGCRFRDRCDRAQPDCAAAEPPLVTLAGPEPHQVACFHPLEGEFRR
jgi:peptide/nickel transport system ATP-binding protein